MLRVPDPLPSRSAVDNRQPYDSVRSRAARAVLDEHYDVGANLYKFWASPGSVLGAMLRGWERCGHPAELHYAWDLERASSLDEGIRETTRRAIALLALDARAAPRLYEPGCGIGGGVTQVARERPGAAVVGMTLVRRQAQIGRARARALRIANAHVCCGNYLAAPFADASFDGIFAIETAVYTPASERARLMREMFRLLAPGCRLAVLDGVKLREPASAAERARIQNVLDGWTMPSPATPEEFGAHARAAGFEVLQQEDVTAHVYASALRIASIATHVLRPLSVVARIPLLGGSMAPLGFASPGHARRFVAACRSQVAVFDAGLGAYYAQVFRKPMH